MVLSDLGPLSEGPKGERVVSAPKTLEQLIREKATMREDLTWARSMLRHNLHIILAPGHFYAATFQQQEHATRLVQLLNREITRDAILAMFHATTATSGRAIRSFINDAVEEAVNYRLNATVGIRSRCQQISATAMMCGFNVGEGAVFELMCRPGYVDNDNNTLSGLLIDQVIRGHYLGSLHEEKPVLLATIGEQSSKNR